jgi:hypothetical protein
MSDAFYIVMSLASLAVVGVIALGIFKIKKVNSVNAVIYGLLLIVATSTSVLLQIKLYELKPALYDYEKFPGIDGSMAAASFFIAVVIVFAVIKLLDD